MKTVDLTNNDEIALDKLSNKTLFSYMLGGLGDNIIFVMIVTFLMIYYTDSVGIPAATVGTIFLITRIWDTLSDLLWGWIFDNTHTRFGKFRPYILIGGVACAIALVATYSVPKMSMGATIAYAYITYFILSTTYTSFDVPYWAMSTTITRNPVERNKAVIITRIGAMCGQWLTSLITLPLLVFFAHSWTVVSLIYALFFIICAVINFSYVKEVHVVQKSTPHSPKIYMELLSKNRPLVVLMCFWFIFNLVISARVGFGLYFFKYQVGSETAMASFLGLSTFVTLLGALITAPLIRWLGKRLVCIVSSLLLGVICVSLFFIHGLPEYEMVIFNSIPNLFMGILGVVLGSMLPDTAAWHELHNNKRVEGMIFSLNLFQLKLSGAIGGALTGFILGFVNYVPNVAQSPYTLLGINCSFTLIPGILFLVAPLILLAYQLNEQENNNVAIRLAERDAQS